MEGLCRSYSSPAASIRRTLRRETRSISEWREKGKYQPFDLSKAAEYQAQRIPDRARTWDGSNRKSVWSPTVSIEIEFRNYDDDDESVLSDEEEEKYEGVYTEDGYVYRSPAPMKEKSVRDYFSVPRTSILEEEEATATTTTTTTTEELFAEEPLAADIPEAELESSRRRSIEIERQPLFLETKEDIVPVEEIIQHLTSPAAAELPTIKTTIVETREELDTTEPPSPEEIIEHTPPPSRGSNDAPNPDFPTVGARNRFLKAKKVLFTVDVLKKCIPPAPPPDELIEEPRSRKPKTAPQPPKAVTPPPAEESVTPPAKKLAEIRRPVPIGFGGVALKLAKKMAEEPAKELEVTKKVPVVVAKPATEEAPIVQEPVVEMAPAPIVIEVTPVQGGVQLEEPIVSTTQGGVSLTPTPPPVTTVSQHLYPPRSDEGYLSGESDNESDDGNSFGVSLVSALHETSSPEAEAPLPEDIITTTTIPKQTERYQHHCLLHGHFFPKAGPLRSPGFPHEPFFPLINCDRCQRVNLVEAWQCSLLNQCGIIVCTPCHNELVYGVASKKEEEPEAPGDHLDAMVVGVKQGLELGMQRGLKIGFEVGLAGKAKEIMERQSRETKRRASETPDNREQMGFKSSRSFESAPKVARRKMSVG